MDSFNDILKRFDNGEVLSYLVDMNRKLSKGEDLEESDFNVYRDQLNQLVEEQKKRQPQPIAKKKKAEQSAAPELKVQSSLNVFKLVSRNLVMVLRVLSSKIYDTANSLLNDVYLDEHGNLSQLSKVAIIILIDLFEHFPSQLGSLISFCVAQIYKILKKDTNIDSDLIYLLYSVSKNATKQDIDEKLCAKLIKISTKSILQDTISFDIEDEKCSTTVLLKKNYVQCLKNLLVLSISSHYESLVEASASSSSAGAKMKPETIMTQQYHFQQNILSTNEKVFEYSLSSPLKEVRVAGIDLLSNLLINFTPTGNFSAIEYLIRFYPLPDENNWDASLSVKLDTNGEPIVATKKERNSILHHDSPFILRSQLEQNILQSSIAATIIFYIQMEQFQNPDYLSSNLINILQMVLLKFDDLKFDNDRVVHIQDTNWNKTLTNWKVILDYVVKETGSAAGDILSNYLYSKLNSTANKITDTKSGENTESVSLNRDKKRESRIFGFKTTKSSKKKTTGSDINIFRNPYQASLILSVIETIIPGGTNIESSEERDKDEEKKTVNDLEDDLEVTTSSDTRGLSFLENTLFTLIANDNFYTRNNAIKTLLTYARFNPAHINQLILFAFKFVDQEHKHSDIASARGPHNTCSIASVRLLSYSLALSSLIKQTDPALLQNTIIVRVLSFCTQNLKHSGNSNIKNSSCWVILASLVSLYNFSEYVKLNSSQLLIFWKSLLTSQFLSVNSGLSGSDETNEVISNLKVRAFALVCLHNYLKSVDLTPESFKQISFLLTKSYNYLSHLESTIENVSAVTTLNADSFNDYDYNPNILNNILYTNHSFNGKLSSERMIVSLVFYTKKVILQSYKEIASSLKSEINSNLVIFLIKIFSDHRIFSRNVALEGDKSSKSKSKYISVHADSIDDSVSYFGEDYNYNFGLTSKWPTEVKYRPTISEKDLREQTPPTNSVFTLHNNGRAAYWFHCLEEVAFSSSSRCISWDPNDFLTNDTPLSGESSSMLMTSLVDLAIDLFKTSFAHLTSKIQFSLLEQIRNSLTAHQADELRIKAIMLNVSVAMNGVVKNMSENELNLDNGVASTLIDVIKKINLKNAELLTLNSETMGLTALLINKDEAYGVITNLINDVVTDGDPFQRGFSVLSMANIYSKKKIGLKETYNILTQLLNDQNPVVYYFTLQSLVKLFESNSDMSSLAPHLLERLYNNYLDNHFGYNVADNVSVSLKTRFGSIGIMARLLQLIITSLGPELREWQRHDKATLRNLIVTLSYGIGLATSDDYIEIYKQLMELFKELIIFDPNLIEGEIGVFTKLLNLIISKNMKIAVANVSPTSLNTDSIFPFTASFDLYSSAYSCYYELVKIYGVGIISQETEYLFWVSMNIVPCPELEQLVLLWIECSLEKNWFNTLNTLLKSSMKKLVDPFLESNYQQKLLPLSQRQKKHSKANVVDFKDEENEGIVDENEVKLEKNEPITLQFRIFIYDALNHLLSLAYKNPNLIERLKSKIAEIVKLSFLGASSPILELKLKGLDLLNSALELFGDLEDPLYPSTSILEQQQAQIISALVPCFAPGNDYKVIAHAIGVSSNFINLPRIKYYSKQRILKTLIQLLEEISSNKFLKFGFLEDMSEFGKKSIQLAILNCWALLRIEAYEDPDQNEDEFEQVLEKYSELLISLWILSLREYSIVKYSESSSRELEIYGNYWINLVTVLSLETETNFTLINDSLSGDSDNFFFILFSQCIESLIKNKNIVPILKSFNKLMRISTLVDLAFNDHIFGELIDIIDRYMLVEDDAEVQCLFLDSIEAAFRTYITSHQADLESGFDKLFELIRVTMIPLFRILPFLKSDFDNSSDNYEVLLRNAETAPNLLILKKTFENLVKMISMFPNVVKQDLYSCLLYIFAKVYESKKVFLISVILPYLKQVVIDCTKLGTDFVKPFYDIISKYYSIDAEDNYTVLTSVILVSYGGIQLNAENSKKLSDGLLQLLSSENSASLSLQCIKSLMQEKGYHVDIVLKDLIADLVNEVTGIESSDSVNSKLAFEILVLYTRNVVENKEKLTAIYSLLLPVLTKNGANDKLYTRDKLLSLVKQDPQVFKEVINKFLTPSQRSSVEELIKLKGEASQETKGKSMTEEGIEGSINLASSLLFAPPEPHFGKDENEESNSADVFTPNAESNVTDKSTPNAETDPSEDHNDAATESNWDFKEVKLFSGQMINLERREHQQTSVQMTEKDSLYMDMDSLFAKVELKNKIKDNSAKLDSKTERNTSKYMPLWTEKYKPQNFLQLCPAGNERQYRLIMRWLQKWSPLVFGERVKETDGTDSLGRPIRKILLIHGPPGVGKTVATHILARQMGYNIQELNAMNSMDTLPQGSMQNSGTNNPYSNASSALKLKIQNTLTSNAVSKNGKPFCLLIDELDSLANTNDVVKILQDIVNADQRAYSKQRTTIGLDNKDQRKSKKADRILNRPIICIANDIYSRQQGRFGPNPLEKMRVISDVVTFRKPAIVQRATGAKVSGSAMKSVKDFLMTVSDREKLGLDYKDIGEICEVCDGDLRACLNQMQFSGRRVASLHNAKKVSPIDKHISWFTMVEDVFKRDPQLKKEDNFKVVLQKYMDGNGKSITGSNDLIEKFINGVFNKYLDIVHLQDDSLTRPGELSDWLHYHDLFNNNFNDATQYNASIALKSWTLFSDLKNYGDITSLIPSVKNLSFESFEKMKENRHIVKTVISSVPPNTRLALGSTNDDNIACCFLPCLTKILTPSLSSKLKSNLNSNEAEKLQKVISLIDAFKLTLETKKDFETGQTELKIGPDWDSLSVFDTFVAGRSSSIETKQLQLKRQTLFPLISAELDGLKTLSETGKHKLDDVKVSESKRAKIGKQGGQTFKSEYDSVKSATKSDNDIVKQVPRIWVNFNEGYSNAVRKEVCWKDIWSP
ncbi:hypothetical protein I9W82_000202 [Candida metapsilosis]|uniref:AAA+ ATPase domain-containing protein n=1 Tax=Candida metapsilosis TaxID=273372 RepID=A0A8H7ZKZ2_9ASCO|nr:hypothetical protein I9W82_000202 [Candida metapsilosis]